MVDPEKVKADGIRLLEEFSEKLKDVPESGETHYVEDLRNIWRPDGEPKRLKGFRDKFGRLSSNFRDGYIVAEKGE